MIDIKNNFLLLVNKEHRLNKNYVPDLITMDNQYAKNIHNKIHPLVYNYFQKMVNKAKEDNIVLYSVSAYRSYMDQEKIFASYVKEDGLEKAKRYSAFPGSSEHQTGLAIDINTCFIKDHFERTKEYAWLKNNAYKYGFILRYPKDKELITGYVYEPWHYRYVGVEYAKYIYDHDLTLEEYCKKFI